MQSDQMNTAFLENSNMDSSESDSKLLDDLVNPRSISVLLGELERNKNVQHTAVHSVPIAAGENTVKDDTNPTYFDIDHRKSSRVEKSSSAHNIQSRKDDQISELMNDLESEENLNSELAKENNHLKQRIAKLELEQPQFVQNKIDEHIKHEKELNESHRNHIQTLKEKNEETSLRLRTAKVRHKKLKNELQRSQLALKTSEENSKSIENEYNRLEEKHNRLEENSSRLEEKSSRLEEEYNRLEEEYNRLEEEYRRLEEESNGLKHDLKTSEDSNQNLQRQIKFLQEHKVPPSNSCCNIS